MDLKISSTENVVYDVPVDLIEIGSNQRLEGNAGFDKGSLQELANSIHEDGLTNPITVRRLEDGRYRLVAGERRYRAVSQFLKWPTTPAFVREMDDLKERAVMAHENIGRVDLNPIEEGLVFEEFVEADRS